MDRNIDVMLYDNVFGMDGAFDAYSELLLSGCVVWHLPRLSVSADEGVGS